MRIAESSQCEMRNAEWGMRNEHQKQKRTNVRKYEGTISNAECEVRNAKYLNFECRISNVESLD